jgi:hypothetical protein
MHDLYHENLAKNRSSNIMVDEKSTMMDTAPFMWEGNTYVPLRFLAEGIGANVTWDQASQTAWVKAGNDTLTFWVGKVYMEVNGMKKEIGAPIVQRWAHASPITFYHGIARLGCEMERSGLVNYLNQGDGNGYGYGNSHARIRQKRLSQIWDTLFI